MPIIIVILGLLAVLFAMPMHAQTQPWSLEQCCDYAVEHNITIKQQENQCRQQEIQLSTARNQRLPDLSGSAGQNFSFGRGLTAQNTYTNTNTSSTSFSLGTSVPLFTGFQIPNNIKLNQLNLEAATQDLVAQSQLTATQANNNLQLAILSMTQLLELESPEGFSVVRPEISSVGRDIIATPDDIYADALATKPEIQAQQLRLRATENSIKIAQAGYYPTLSFSAGLGSNYYKTSGFKADDFSTQMKNNFSQYLGFNLNIPIFNRFQTRNSVRSAKLDRENQTLQLDNTKKALYKEIQQVYYNAVAANQKLTSSLQASESSETAFRLTQAKYEQGKSTITEFNEAKNNWLKSESDLTQARYEYLYQLALIRFYSGQTLKL